MEILLFSAASAERIVSSMRGRRRSLGSGNVEIEVVLFKASNGASLFLGVVYFGHWVFYRPQLRSEICR